MEHAVHRARELDENRMQHLASQIAHYLAGGK